MVSQYVQAGFALRNSSHPSVGSTVTVTVFWVYVGAAAVEQSVDSTTVVHSYVGYAGWRDLSHAVQSS